jgi:hypothetical protein
MVSSTYVGGFLRALRKLELLTPALIAPLSDGQRAMIDSPYSRGWWEGGDAERVALATLELHGSARLEEVGLLTTRNSVGPIVTPFISVIGAIFGLRPSTLLERMSELAGTSVRGVAFEWKSTSETTGVLKIVYPPSNAGRTFEPLWRGACRFIFEVSKSSGSITESHVNGSAIALTLSWDPKRS